MYWRIASIAIVLSAWTSVVAEEPGPVDVNGFVDAISALPEASTHVNPDPVRTRKLLLNADEIKKLIGKVEHRGYTVVPLNLHFKEGRIKVEIGLAKGKKQHDKRDTEKEKDWKREQEQLMKKRVS